MLIQQQVVVDPALSNVSIKYSNDTFIADLILPMIKTSKQTGKYFIYDKSNLRIDKTTRAVGAGANETDIAVNPTGVFSCDDHALKGFVAQEIQDQADAPLNPLIDETEAITEKLMLDRENNAAVLLQNTSNLTQNTTLSGTSQWSDYVNSDPIGDIRTARTTVHQNTFKKPNTIILSKLVIDMLSEHPAIIDRIKYSQLGVTTEDLLAKIFKVDKILVGEAGSNTAKEGQTDSLSYVWGKGVIVAFISPQIHIKMLTLGATFTYSVRQVMRWYDFDKKGTFIRVGDDNYQQVIIAAAAGYLIQNAIA